MAINMIIITIITNIDLVLSVGLALLQVIYLFFSFGLHSNLMK